MKLGTGDSCYFSPLVISGHSNAIVDVYNHIYKETFIVSFTEL